MSLLFRLYPYIFGVTALVAITVVVWMRGYDACQNEYTEKALKLSEVKNEIRNMPHDVDTTADRLQRGTF